MHRAAGVSSSAPDLMDALQKSLRKPSDKARACAAMEATIPAPVRKRGKRGAA